MSFIINVIYNDRMIVNIGICLNIRICTFIFMYNIKQFFFFFSITLNTVLHDLMD